MKSLVMYGNPIIEEKIQEFVYKYVPNYDEKSFSDKKMVLEKLIRGCKNCSLHYETPFSPIPSIINENCTAVFVGRNPNRTEAQENKLYPEGTNVGNLFEKYLSLLGLSKSEVSVINMANCYAKNNRPPEQEIINKCIAFKKMEMDLIGDSYVVVFLMGNDACRWAFGLNSPGVLSVLGDVYYTQIKGRNVAFIPVLHPSHLLIDPSYKNDVYTVLVKSKEIIDKIKLEEKKHGEK